MHDNDMRERSGDLVAAARAAQIELAQAWAESGCEAARQLKEANRMAIFQSRMDHIDAAIADLLRRREVLEAKLSDAPDILSRVYAAQLSTLDSQLERFASEAELTAREMRTEIESLMPPSPPAESNETLYRRSGSRFVPIEGT